MIDNRSNGTTNFVMLLHYIEISIVPMIIELVAGITTTLTLLYNLDDKNFHWGFIQLSPLLLPSIVLTF